MFVDLLRGNCGEEQRVPDCRCYRGIPGGDITERTSDVDILQKGREEFFQLSFLMLT